MEPGDVIRLSDLTLPGRASYLTDLDEVIVRIEIMRAEVEEEEEEESLEMGEAPRRNRRLRSAAIAGARVSWADGLQGIGDGRVGSPQPAGDAALPSGVDAPLGGYRRRLRLREY